MSDSQSIKNLNSRIQKNGAKINDPNTSSAERKKALKMHRFDVKMRDTMRKNQTTDSNN